MSKRGLFIFLCALVWLSAFWRASSAGAQEPDRNDGAEVNRKAAPASVREIERCGMSPQNAASSGRLHHGGLSRINTPEAQKIRKKYQPQMNLILAEVRELRGRCAKELSQEKPNKENIKNYVNKISELRCRQQMLLVDQMFEILETLPKEKRSEYLQPLIERCLK